MLGWIIRVLLISAAGIAGWFIARDAPNFSTIEMLVFLVLMAAVIAAAVFGALLRDKIGAKSNPPA